MTVTRKPGPISIAGMSDALKSLGEVQAKVGWFESATYANGTPVAYVATIQEYGSGSIPARPFMRPAVADNGPEWVELIGQGAKAVLAGSHEPAQVLEMVALKAAGDVGKKIAEVTSPPLSPITLLGRAQGGFKGGKEVGAAARKLSQGPQQTNVSTKPLVDTGQMIQSVTGVVEPAGA